MARPARTFGEALAKAQVRSNPATEPKRPVRRSLGVGGSQNPKRPLRSALFPDGYSIFVNALILKLHTPAFPTKAVFFLDKGT